MGGWGRGPCAGRWGCEPCRVLGDPLARLPDEALERRDAFAGASSAAFYAALAGCVGVADVGDVVPDAVAVALVLDAILVLAFNVGAGRVRVLNGRDLLAEELELVVGGAEVVEGRDDDGDREDWPGSFGATGRHVRAGGGGGGGRHNGNEKIRDGKDERGGEGGGSVQPGTPGVWPAAAVPYTRADGRARWYRAAIAVGDPACCTQGARVCV